MRQIEPYHDSYSRLLFAPVIRNLGVMNQLLIRRSLDLGLIQDARQLKRIDNRLLWLLERKDEPEPNGDWDDMWAYDDTELFAKHFDDHGEDFSAKNWNDYAKQSQDFYKKGLEEKFPAVENNDGYIKMYDPNTNTFGVYDPEGKTVNFYKPTSPTYFERQVQIELEQGGRIVNPLINALPGPEDSGTSGRTGGGRGMSPFEKPGNNPADQLPEE